MNAAVVSEIVASVLRTLAAGEGVDPPAVQLLIRQYAATGDDVIGNALSPALGALTSIDNDDLEGWLVVCAEAAQISDDEQLAMTAASLSAALRRQWGVDRPVAAAMRGIVACLRAAGLVESRDLVRAAVDELERVIGRHYEPGEGVGGGVDDEVGAAAALLTAYDVTARLPYAMLADELAQVARRDWSRSENGSFDTPEPFLSACEMARVCCRLAALYADADYRRAAVVAAGLDYAAVAGRMLSAQMAIARARGARAAPFALALGEWLALGSELQ